MIKKNDKEAVIKEINDSKVENIFNIIPNISDKVMDYNEVNFNIVDMINNTFEDKRTYSSVITPALIILSGVQSRMKQQFSISELSLALTSKKIVEQINFNISYNPNESLLKEPNIRAWLKKHENEEKGFNFNNDFIKFFNTFNDIYLEATKTSCDIHILDCSILDVNINNQNYEGSTITYKGGERLRGYKIGMLRGVTSNGGVVEEICMSTAKTNDVNMSEDMILNTKYLKPGDYILEDRGFIDIEIFRALVEKEVKVIIPVKKNMEIYEEAKLQSKSNNKWKKHPNPKREGQEISLVENLEYAWLTSDEKNKKIEKIKLGYKLNACVIRFDKEKNKDVLTDEEIIATDDKYAYACIITNDTSLSCDEIIRLYEMRPEIEEDFRQLKDFWGLNAFKSTKYQVISFVIILSLLGYNFYQIYKESDEGKQYIGKSLIVEERHGLYIVKGVRTAIVTNHYFGMFEQDELLDLYANLDKEKRELIKKYLVL